MPSLADKKVTLCRSLAGELTVQWKGQAVASRAVTQRPAAVANRLTLTDRVANHTEPEKCSRAFGAC